MLKDDGCRMTEEERRFFTQAGFSSRGRMETKTYSSILLCRAFPVFDIYLRTILVFDR